ncbi:MAG TPA: efflux RND transporter permease subunit, partial [Thiolinea sp.]|nr:efflux RND transporter permease subunit [Thiolinea sp.]
YQSTYSNLVSQIGNKTNEIKVSMAAQEGLLEQATASREGLSGVNLDEEAANLIRAQALDLPAGVLETAGRNYQLRFENLRRTPQALADLVIMNTDNGGEVRLGDIATIRDEFSVPEQRSTINGQPATLLLVSKNQTDDTLRVYDAVKAFVDAENQRLPAGTHIHIVLDVASIVRDRLNLLVRNGWQGLLLATGVLFLFFTWRYTFWVAMGLPISFLGGLVVMSALGVTINMISMVALLMAIGILMDDAIVISESIESEYRKDHRAGHAVITGVSKVASGVFSSYLTSALLFGSLLFMKGDLGQIMGVLPVVLLSVLTVSLVEAFLILPAHLHHSLEKRRDAGGRNILRRGFDAAFTGLTQLVGRLAYVAIKLRYLVVGGTIALLIFSASLLASGVVKFKGFPDIEGNQVDARILMPQGTPIERTEAVVDQVLQALEHTLEQLPPEPKGELVRLTRVSYSENQDASESGPHLATIGLELLGTEERNISLRELERLWRLNLPVIPDAISI